MGEEGLHFIKTTETGELSDLPGQKKLNFIKIIPEETDEEAASETSTSDGMVTMVVAIEEELLRMVVGLKEYPEILHDKDC